MDYDLNELLTLSDSELISLYNDVLEHLKYLENSIISLDESDGEEKNEQSK